MKKEDTPLARLRIAMAADTNKELAKKLCISRFIPSMVTAGGIPDRHLLKAVERGYNPRWITHGDVPRYLIQSNFPYFNEFPAMKVGLPHEF